MVDKPIAMDYDVSFVVSSPQLSPSAALIGDRELHSPHMTVVPEGKDDRKIESSSSCPKNTKSSSAPTVRMFISTLRRFRPSTHAHRSLSSSPFFATITRYIRVLFFPQVVQGSRTTSPGLYQATDALLSCEWREDSAELIARKERWIWTQLRGWYS
ncbi:hypothetical protein PQX77_012835 [Marasmius sp. AFHP31]|nr:hypothetical protein PQX77_012835 [Marasmius sp. AFHP31]